MADSELADFADRVNDLMPVVIREFGRRQENALYKGKITLPQFFILGILHKQGSAKMTDLARAMGVSTPAVTGIVDRLVRDKYTLREYNPKDRRVIKIKITSKGEALLKEISQQRRLAVMNVFGKISSQERKDYLKILSHVHQVLLDEKP